MTAEGQLCKVCMLWAAMSFCANDSSVISSDTSCGSLQLPLTSALVISLSRVASMILCLQTAWCIQVSDKRIHRIAGARQWDWLRVACAAMHSSWSSLQLGSIATEAVCQVYSYLLSHLDTVSHELCNVSCSGMHQSWLCGKVTSGCSCNMSNTLQCLICTVAYMRLSIATFTSDHLDDIKVAVACCVITPQQRAIALSCTAAEAIVASHKVYSLLRSPSVGTLSICRSDATMCFRDCSRRRSFALKAKRHGSNSRLIRDLAMNPSQLPPWSFPWR